MSKQKAVVLVGLCGSGKSRLAAKMASEEGYAIAEGIEHQESDGSRKRYDKLVDALKAGKNCVIEEMQTLASPYRAWLEAELKRLAPGLEVEFRFFEKNLA